MDKIKNLLLALLIYSSTIVAFPKEIIYVLISFIGVIWMLQDLKLSRYNNHDLFILLLFMASLPIYYLGANLSDTKGSRSINEWIPYTFFIVSTIFFSKRINKEILHIILILILFEIAVGVIEFALNKPYLVKQSVEMGETAYGDTDFLYFNRVYGLSASISIFAQKVFTGFILCYFLDLKKYRFILLGILSIGVLVSFNRTAIVAVTAFLLLNSLMNFKKVSTKQVLFVGVLFLVSVFLLINFSDTILYQLFRGKDQVDLSGRDGIFKFYYSFIEENLFFGNYVHKLWLEISKFEVYHAHNSYLQTLANLGIFLTSILVLYLVKVIKGRSLVYVVPILIYSIFQYGILWGVSYLDIVFFSIIFHFYNEKNKSVIVTRSDLIIDPKLIDKI